jgi:hypothetical protein
MNTKNLLNNPLFSLIIIIIIALIIASMISIAVGFLSFVGLCFLVASGYILLKKKGNVTINLQSPFFICVLIGLVLIVMSSAGLEVATLDLSMVPGLKELNVLAHSI